MNPKHLTPIVGETSKDFLVSNEWVKALIGALEDEIGASEDVQAALNEAEDTVQVLEHDIEVLEHKFDTEEERRLELEIDIEQVRNELEEYRRTSQDAI